MPEADDRTAVTPAVTRWLLGPPAYQILGRAWPQESQLSFPPVGNRLLQPSSSVNVHSKVHNAGTDWPNERMNEGPTACCNGRSLSYDCCEAARRYERAGPT